VEYELLRDFSIELTKYQLTDLILSNFHKFFQKGFKFNYTLKAYSHMKTSVCNNLLAISGTFNLLYMKFSKQLM